MVSEEGRKVGERMFWKLSEEYYREESNLYRMLRRVNMGILNRKFDLAT